MGFFRTVLKQAVVAAALVVGKRVAAKVAGKVTGKVKDKLAGTAPVQKP